MHLTRNETLLSREFDTLGVHLTKLITGVLALILLIQIQMDEGETWGYLQIVTTWVVVLFVTSTIKSGIRGVVRYFSKS